MVTADALTRFYYRTGTGRAVMDVGQIRTAFRSSASFNERSNDLRDLRAAHILADQPPAQLDAFAECDRRWWQNSARSYSGAMQTRLCEICCNVQRPRETEAANGEARIPQQAERRPRSSRNLRSSCGG
jgi:hypothetical protein